MLSYYLSALVKCPCIRLYGFFVMIILLAASFAVLRLLVCAQICRILPVTILSLFFFYELGISLIN